MADKQERSRHILVTGRGQSIAEKHLHEIGLENDKAGDDQLIQLLTGRQWDAASIAGGINGFVLDSPKEATAFYIGSIVWST